MAALIDLPDVVATPASGWRHRWQALRDRLLTSPSFRRWAARFPPTRGIARRRAGQVFDLVAGFVYSQVLVACVRLHLFEILAAGPQTLDALASRLGLPADAAERLLSAAVSLRLVERRGAMFGLGALGAPIVGNAAVAAMVEHHALLYADLADPVALLRGDTGTGRLSRYWSYAASADPATADAQQVASYSTLMSASQPLVAGEILAAVPLHRCACLLDVGGGEGTFLLEAARRTPGLRVVLFDLPAVAERARQRFAAQGIAARSDALGGSFFDGELPRGADAATLIRVLHDHDDDKAAHAAPQDPRRPAARRPADRRRTDGADPRRRGNGRRLLRPVSAGDGQRPAEDAPAHRADARGRRIRRRPTRADGHAVAGTHRHRASAIVENPSTPDVNFS